MGEHCAPPHIVVAKNSLHFTFSNSFDLYFRLRDCKASANCQSLSRAADATWNALCSQCHAGDLFEDPAMALKLDTPGRCAASPGSVFVLQGAAAFIYWSDQLVYKICIRGGIHANILDSQSFPKSHERPDLKGSKGGSSLQNLWCVA